jgi:tRNA threonylcarbamoyladenosine biosynthesis protein TsaB
MSAKSPLNNYYLYLDTSEPQAVLGVYKEEEMIKEIKWEAHRELSRTLSGKYQEILKKAKVKQEDLTGICVFSGPGSFTGLRIGISFANALAYGLGIPIYETRKKNILNTKNPKKIIVPFYGSPPKITKPRKK